MLSSVEQAFVRREEKRAPLKTPAWEAKIYPAKVECRWQITYLESVSKGTNKNLAG